MNELKMTGADDASDSIVLSFAGKWEKRLRSDKVKCVFRKRAPRKFTPKWIYVYLASPRSAIIGRCELISLDRISTPKALAMVDEGSISEQELRAYAFGYETLYVYRIKPVQCFEKTLSWSTLNADYGFSAPQSFFVLSENGKTTVDHLSRNKNTAKKGGEK